MNFAFDAFELDPERLELRSGGERVRIEPRVLEVLVHLVRHRDRVVSKEELAREVWGVAHLTDAALARAIREARKALGDDGSSRKWIETVYGRGYRFTAPVTGRSAGPAPAVAEPDPSPPAGPIPARRHPVAKWPLPAFLLLLLTSAAGVTFRQYPSSPAPVEAQGLRMAFVPIAAQGDDLELRFAALSISDLLRQRLEDVSGLDLRPARPDGGIDVSAIARRTRADYVLSGRLAPSESGGGALTVFLHQLLPTGAVREVVLGTHSVPYLDHSPDLRRFVEIRDTVTQRLAGELAQRVDFSSPLGSEPKSLEGYRLYIRALWGTSERVCPQGPELQWVRQALQIDPELAPAWHLYAGIHCNLALLCGGGRENYREALRAAGRAHALAPRRWGPQEVKFAILLETGRTEEAYALLRGLEPRFRDHPRRKLRLSQVLHYAGFLDESRRHLEEVFRTEPGLAGFWDMVPYPYLYSREWDRFLDLTPRGAAPPFVYYRGFAEAMRGRPEEARNVLSVTPTELPSHHFVFLSRALRQILEGELASAERTLKDLSRRRVALGASDGEFNYKIGELLVMAGAPEAGLSLLEQAVRQGFFCVPWLENDPVLEPVRGTPAYERILALARQRHVAFGRRFGLL